MHTVDDLFERHVIVVSACDHMYLIALLGQGRGKVIGGVAHPPYVRLVLQDHEGDPVQSSDPAHVRRE
ncbi:hypothetical protein D3C87_1891790 [compost metagenome]